MAFNLFGGNTQPKPNEQPPLATAKGQIQNTGDGKLDTEKAGVVEPSTDGSGTPDTPKNPLDAYSSLWDTDSKEGDSTDNTPDHLTIPQEALDKVLPTLDFTKSIPAELQQKFNEGDAAAVTQVMNHIGRESYSTAMQHMAAVTDAHLAKRLGSGLTKTIQTEVRSSMTRDTVNNLPNAEHPLIKAELNRVSAQIATKYPEASQEWISQQASQYISSLGDALRPQAQPSATQKTQQIDFMALANEDDS